MSEAVLPDAALALMEAGYHKFLGYQHHVWREGYSEILLPIQPHHLNLSNILHGAVLTGLLDIVCAQSGTYCPNPGHIRKAITLSLTTTFTGQCNSGTIRAMGTLRACGRRIYNASGEVRDEQGRLLAMGEGTFRLRTGSDEAQGEPI